MIGKYISTVTVTSKCQWIPYLDLRALSLDDTLSSATVHSPGTLSLAVLVLLAEAEACTLEHCC